MCGIMRNGISRSQNASQAVEFGPILYIVYRKGAIGMRGIPMRGVHRYARHPYIVFIGMRGIPIQMTRTLKERV